MYIGKVLPDAWQGCRYPCSGTTHFFTQLGTKVGEHVDLQSAGEIMASSWYFS